MSADLLMEIGCEEIPSRYLPDAVEQIKVSSAEFFQENRITHGDIKSWSTPRRLVLHISDVSDTQEDLVKKIKGPPVDKAFDDKGNPTAAASGFARSAGLAVDELGREELKGTGYLVAVSEKKGEPVKELLPEIMSLVASSIRFPRSMYWQKNGARFARPVRWLLCFYGDTEIIFNFAGISSGKITYGHRFLSDGPLPVSDTANYFEVLNANNVILDERQRRQIIMKSLQEKAALVKGKPLFSDKLLEELSYLVEYPEVITGSFAEEYLEIPQEVLITTMQVHQRFVPVISDESDRLLPYFLGISNNRFSDYTRKGYEKVLRARLADARFFFREDTRTGLQDYVEKLKKVVYQEALGTVYDKTERIVYLADFLGKKWQVESDEIEEAKRAGFLSKADLVTDMVKEFPELQGVMGRDYAVLSGETEKVATAVFEHYLPRFSGDILPESIPGILVSLADKADTLAGCFCAGIIPTGSQDPYALRRQALGILNILLEKEIPVSLPELIQEALEKVKEKASFENDNFEKAKDNLDTFILGRIRYLFSEEKKLDHDVTDAVLSYGYGIICEQYRKASLINKARKEDYFIDLMAGFTRVNNLSRKATEDNKVSEELLVEKAEKFLWYAVLDKEKLLQKAWVNVDYQEILILLGSLRNDIDLFFEEILVMDKDDSVRNNRLNLLLYIKKLFDKFADFSQITL